MIDSCIEGCSNEDPILVTCLEIGVIPKEGKLPNPGNDMDPSLLSFFIIKVLLLSWPVFASFCISDHLMSLLLNKKKEQ